MGAFLDLMREAKAKGLKELAFRVNLETLDDAGHADWIAKSPTRSVVKAGRGRTGEESLRSLVEVLT